MIKETQFPERSFERKKQEYFTKLGLQVRDSLKLHKASGMLWEREAGERAWGNVSEHCLVETARADALADKLRLPPELKQDLVIAAALHDFYKRHEREAEKKEIKAGQSGLEAAIRSAQEEEVIMRQAGFKESVVNLVGVVGGLPETLFDVKRILDKDKPTDGDIALLTMQYIDGYTRGSAWVEPAETSGEGKLINDVDRRMLQNIQNLDYKKIQEAAKPLLIGHPFFEGKGLNEAMAELDHFIEERLVALIKARSNEEIDPLRLPEVLDEGIKERINQS